MISIIIPTMWKSPYFVKFLDDIVHYDSVGEIIIINNDMANTPVNCSTLVHKKIVIYNFASNIYVNPAWNLGVEFAAYDTICLMNDDVVFDPRIFSRVEDRFKTNPGLMGIAPMIIKNQTVDGSIDIVPWTGQSTLGFGSLMFMSRGNWIPIPNTLKVYYGDNWIFETSRVRGIAPELITNCFYYTPCATTIRALPGIERLLDTEGEIYRQEFGNFIKNYK